MGTKNWSVLSHLKRAVKKINFLVKLNRSRWRLASMLHRAAHKRRRRCLSFNHNQRGLYESCIEDEQGSTRRLDRTRSVCYSDEDIDGRAEMFIANFHRQLRLERQISLQLRYCRGNSFQQKDEASSSSS